MDSNFFIKAVEDEAKIQEGFIQNIYSKRVPPPNPPTDEQLSFWRIAGIEAVLFTLSGLGVVIFSSIRTGGFFYLMEMILLKHYGLPNIFTQFFSFSSMASSLIAFELYVLADGFSKGRENKKLKRSKRGLYSSLLVIVGAGIFTGFSLIENLSPLFQTVFYFSLAIGTAVAGGIVALYSGENIGFTLTKVDNERERLIKQQQLDYNEWMEKAVEAYRGSNYAYGSKKSKKLKETIQVEDEDSEVKDEYLKFLSANIEKFVQTHNRAPKVGELVKAGIDKKIAELALSQYSENAENG